MDELKRIVAGTLEKRNEEPYGQTFYGLASCVHVTGRRYSGTRSGFYARYKNTEPGAKEPAHKTQNTEQEEEVKKKNV